MKAPPTRRRRLFIVLLLLVALLGAGLLAAFALLDVGVIRSAAEARLSTLLGQPVSIGDLRVSMFPVPSLIGSEIRIGPERDAPDLAMQRIRIVPRVGSLFGGPYIVREVALEGLTVRVVREPPGRWRFPAVIPAPGGGGTGQVVIERVRLRGGRVGVFSSTASDGVRELSSIDDVAGEATTEASRLRISPIRGRVGGAAISGEATLDPREARIDFSMPEIRNEDLRAVLGLAAADPPASLGLAKPAAASMSIRIDREKLRLAGTGSLRAPEIRIESLQLQGLEAPIATDGVHLTFNPASFSVYRGTHRGKVDIDLSKDPARWSLDGKVDGVDVSDFLRAFSGGEQRIDGTASATTALRGTVGEPIPQTLDGRMWITVANGVIHEFPLLAAINRALRLAEGDTRDTRFERLSVTLAFSRPGARSSANALASGFATTDDLVLEAREVRVEVAGRIGFDRSLHLAGQAVLSPDRTAGAIRSIRELSGLRNDRGELELPVTITGTLDNPSFAIDLQAAVGRSLKEELRRRLRDLIPRRRER